MRFARSLAAGAILLLLCLSAQHPALAQRDANSETITIKFADDTVVLERKYFNVGLSKNSIQKGLSEPLTSIEISSGRSIFVRIPFEPPLSESVCVKSIGEVLLRNRMLPAHGSAEDRERLNLGAYKASQTNFEGVARLAPSTGLRSLDLYEFERNDLRDFWGDKQTFYISGRLARLNIQIRKNVLISAGLVNDTDCFFKDGAAIVEHIRRFVLDRLQTK